MRVRQKNWTEAHETFTVLSFRVLQCSFKGACWNYSCIICFPFAWSYTEHFRVCDNPWNLNIFCLYLWEIYKKASSHTQLTAFWSNWGKLGTVGTPSTNQLCVCVVTAVTVHHPQTIYSLIWKEGRRHRSTKRLKHVFLSIFNSQFQRIQHAMVGTWQILISHSF